MLHLLSLLALVGLALGASPDAAHIEVDRQPDRYTLTGTYSGPASGDLTYSMTVTRAGASGRSSSTQSGSVIEGTALSTSTVNVSAGDRVLVELTVRAGDRVVAEDRLDEVVGD